ncbi:MAG: CsgG/HfaB family protein [Gemmatimonadota bacterium]|nr:CsgG/HfaB family protein [Gemmatimonadota bacterium]
MKSRVLLRISVLSALILSATTASPVSGQTQPISSDSVLYVSLNSAPPASSATFHNDKPAVMVMGFESGTVTAQVRDKRGLGAILTGMRRESGGESYDPSQLGIGIADMLIEKLLETGQFRLVERKPLEPGNGAQFIVTGSVTKFGFEEHNFGGIAANMATMGMLSFKQHRTEVTLTARVVNAATGEIVASMSGEGRSKKGGGLRVAGIGGHGFGGADVSSANFRGTAIGEATERAVSNLAEKIVQKKGAF